MKNLKKDLNGDPPSVLKLKKQGIRSLSGGGLWINGGAMVIGGLNQVAKEANEGGPPYEKSPSVNASLVIGLGVMVVPFLFMPLRERILWTRFGYTMPTTGSTYLFSSAPGKVLQLNDLLGGEVAIFSSR